jgi:hypothetical protein
MIYVAVLMLLRKQRFAFGPAACPGWLLGGVLVRMQRKYPGVGQQHPHKAQEQQESQTRPKKVHYATMCRERGKCKRYSKPTTASK